MSSERPTSLSWVVNMSPSKRRMLSAPWQVEQGGCPSPLMKTLFAEVPETWVRACGPVPTMGQGAGRAV